MSKNKPTMSNVEYRRQLEADMKSFLKAGNKIQQIPTGVSNQDFARPNKHITLGKPKQAKPEPANEA